MGEGWGAKTLDKRACLQIAKNGVLGGRGGQKGRERTSKRESRIRKETELLWGLAEVVEPWGLKQHAGGDI